LPHSGIVLRARDRGRPFGRKWPLHDSYGLPLERIPDVIAHTVELIIRDLRTHVTDDTPT
jgi:hypothetical protein